MAQVQSSQFLTLVQREFREYRTSMLWTPIITAVILGVLMVGSIILANRISFIGESLLDALLKEGGSELSISISMNDDSVQEVLSTDEFQVVQGLDEPGSDEASAMSGEVDAIAPPAPPPAPEYEVTIEESPDGAEWNFSREWNFNPDPVDANGGGSGGEEQDLEGRELNAILSVVHGILLLTLLVTSANYLLGSLYDDRKDRSILFWRSMPVGELQVVLSKFVVAIALAPLIYIAISVLLQLTYVILMMVLVWRMDEDPFSVVLDNIDFAALMLDPISGWVMTALLIAPTYAWLLLASALAKRSPFMMAVVPIVALFIAEATFFGSEYIGDAVTRHFPHLSDTSSVGFYLFGPNWTNLNLLSLAGGLIFTIGALALAVWLRKHRWELN